MINGVAIREWSKTVPWKTDAQIEQDLLISRALVAIFSDEFLSTQLAFRGGTALHKLYISPQIRYSEDLDLVQINPGPIKPIMYRLGEVLDFLPNRITKQKRFNNTMVFRLESEMPPIVPLRIKCEINCFENFKNNVPRNMIDLIPMIDVELDNDCKKHPEMSLDDIKNSLKKFIKLIEDYYGCKPMIYGTMRSYNTYCAPTFNYLHLYIGRYGTKSPVINGKGTYTIWQYSESGHLPGISRPVDLCKFNEKYSVEDIALK